MARFFRSCFMLCLVVTVAIPVLCAAQETGDDTTAGLIRLLQEKGVVSRAEAERLLARQRGGGEDNASADSQRVIIEQVTENVGERFSEKVEQVRQDLLGVSSAVLKRTRLAERNIDRLDQTLQEDVRNELSRSGWARRIRWGGDIRLRYQGDMFDEGNSNQIFEPSDPTTRMNTSIDRHRGRIRVRLAAKTTILDDREANVGKVEAGVRIATGNETDPVSTNDTLGDYSNKDDLLLDQAYLTWSFKPQFPVFDKIPSLSITGGRIPNPWFSTDLVWDGDISFEGAALQLKSDTLDGSRWHAFVTMGAFPLEEVELVQDDKWMYGAQVGVRIKPRYDIDATLALAYFDYRNIEGKFNDALRPNLLDYTVPGFQQKGNTLIDIDPESGYTMALASDYDILNVTARLDLGLFHPTHVILTADYARNLAFDAAELSERTGEIVPEEDEGYLLGISVGDPVVEAYSDWRLSLTYKHLEGDAVLDAFTDSDFHLGGTNAEGWILGAEYGLYKNVWMSARWLTSDQIEGPAIGVDTVQIDINARY